MSDFNKLWAGQTVSLLGTAVTLFALPTLAVLVLHATPLQLGTLTALETLPFPLLGMFVGVLADRFSRRRMMIVADIVRFAALAAIPAAAAFGVLRMPLLCAIALVSGTAAAFFGIAYQSYLPVVVDADRLTQANAKLEFSNSGSAMTGTALAGALVQWIGAAAAIAVDAVSYLVSVASLIAIRKRELPHEGPPLSVRQGAREMVEGLKLVFDSPDLRWILGATGTSNLGSGIINAVFLIYAYRILHLKPGLLGLIDGLAEIGFVGALLSTPVRERIGLRPALILSLAVAGVASGSMLFAQLGAPYVVIFLVSAVMAISIPVYNVNQVSYRQALVDVRMQGRLNATIRTFVWGTLPLGSVIGGYLGARLGVPETIAIGAFVTGAAALWLMPLRERSAAPLDVARGPSTSSG